MSVGGFIPHAGMGLKMEGADRQMGTGRGVWVAPGTKAS